MSNTNTALNCKVVILGESGVGKTCIINRYINNTFNPDSMTTSGASYASKTMYFEQFQKNMKFDIWDTAGQERFRTLTTGFYKKADGICVCFDVTAQKTFDGIKEWEEQIRENAHRELKQIRANAEEYQNGRSGLDERE